MRLWILAYTFAVLGLAVADILDSPEFAGIWPNEDLVVANSEAEQTTDLTLAGRSPQDTSTSSLAKRQAEGLVVLGLIQVASKVWSVFSWVIGLFGLAASSYGVYKDCKATFNITECLLASFGLVISAFGTTYKAFSGKVRVRSDGLYSHAEWTDPDDSMKTSEAHVPLDGCSLKMASMASENNGTFERHATYYWGGAESHYLLYRRAAAEDLGFENDGSYHHYRVQDSDSVKQLRTQMANGHPGIERRIEKRSYGIVTDYIWKNGNKALWNSMHDSADFKDMARKTTNFMENGKHEVSCLTPIARMGTHGGSSSDRIDNGIIAYGWNDNPFSFNGRSGNWVNRCKGKNI